MERGSPLGIISIDATQASCPTTDGSCRVLLAVQPGCITMAFEIVWVFYGIHLPSVLSTSCLYVLIYTMQSVQCTNAAFQEYRVGHGLFRLFYDRGYKT